MNVHTDQTQFDPDKLALDNCDQEPIHTPGRVQPFGALIAAPLDLSQVQFASANLAEIIGVDPAVILGKQLKDVVGPQVSHDIRNVLSVSTSATQRERVTVFELSGRMLEVFAHRNPNDQAVIEFEPLEAANGSGTLSAVERMRRILAKAGEQKSLNNMLTVCVHGLRDLTGFDRVKAYRYSSNGDGEVVAESRASKIESFLGLRYPAWDVPQQARALQIKNPVRMISDVRQDPVPVLAHSEDLAPLDMALAHTRGISPIHVEYLNNMGVGATLTIGLVVEGKLWGMFACHHMSPYLIASDQRIAVEVFGQMISLLIQQRQELEKTDARAVAGDARRQMLANTDAATDLLHAFPDLAPILQKVVACDGLCVLRDDKVQTLGSTPSSEAIRAIGKRLPDDEDLLEATDSLIQAGWANGNPLNNTAGCFLIRCTAAYPLQMMFFRDDKVTEVKWAGKPVKDVVSGPMGSRLTPRGSFAAYVEEQSGASRDWTRFDHEAGRELQILLTQITAKGERSQMLRHKDLVTHQRQQELMIAELNHRVKNILALIRSLSRQAKASSASLEGYAQALEQRIAALASAHDLAVSDDMKGASLRGILETELTPYMNKDESQLILSGPTVGLRADVAPMIALVVHEMVTNAAKYGCLSVDDGVLRLKWTVGEDGLSFAWRELGGPRVEKPERHGFGRSLIERAIPYEFDGTVELEYRESGVVMDFTLPPATLVDLEKESSKKLMGIISEIKRVASGLSGLLVEDNIILAMDMVESMTRLGAAKVETAATVQEGMAAIGKQQFDFAILDLNLRGVVSFDLADKLLSQGVPFIFVTGYGSSVDMPVRLAETQVLTKPIDDGSLSLALERILR